MRSSSIFCFLCFLVAAAIAVTAVLYSSPLVKPDRDSGSLAMDQLKAKRFDPPAQTAPSSRG